MNEQPHHSLNVVYGRILRALQELPEDYIYRKNTEELVKQRLALVEQVCLTLCQNLQFLSFNSHKTILFIVILGIGR